MNDQERFERDLEELRRETAILRARNEKEEKEKGPDGYYWDAVREFSGIILR
ncbi:hypothetical protein G6R29_02340 [Fructobacillus sp. M2-14]|uniref:Uncharacterized protein n=1 Tax=Fructobacillus broussonetiae TaxID=2713173 RepID=A0ABS5R1G2_9LACO|nr:hypothetical protein [Fructobacillus broussonetiae]MBS9338476.1 hypothetical protein [Fructobacillus broussonetiae]